MDAEIGVLVQEEQREAKIANERRTLACASYLQAVTAHNRSAVYNNFTAGEVSDLPASRAEGELFELLISHYRALSRPSEDDCEL